MATEIGALSLRLHVDPAGLQRGFAAAEARLKKFGDLMQGGIPVARKFASELKNVGAAVAHALEEPVERLIEAMRNLQAAFERASVAADGSWLDDLTSILDGLPAPFNELAKIIAKSLGSGGAVVLAIAALVAAFYSLGVPISLAILAVVALGVAWLKFGDDIGRIWDDIKGSAVALKDGVVTAVHETYLGVKEWLVDKLSALVDLVREKVAAITGFFKDMWDKVVGESYVPDMIDGIERQFGRLDGAMVRPAEQATDAIAASFEDMASSVTSGLNSMVRQGTTELSDFKQFALGTATDIAGNLARTLGRIGGQALASAFAPAGGGLVGGYDADVTHRGGVIGATSFPTRRVPAPVMAMAPRLHAGFAPDEFPAILQRGETVLPRGGGGPPVRVVINDQRGATAPPIGVRHQAGPDGLREILVNVMAEDARRNGPAFRATAAALGGQRVGRSR